MLTRNQETEAWAFIIAIKIMVLFAMIVIFCSCSAAPKGIVVRDIKYHMTFNRAVMHGDTLINVERWSSITAGIEQDSIINETTIGALVLFHNMHLEHENL